MANQQPQLTTDRNAPVLLDEEDERERVLLVVVRGSSDVRVSGTDSKDFFKVPGALNADFKVPGALNADFKVPGALNAGANDSITYAINVSMVREVIRARAVTRVPGAPNVMRGLVNVRGMVVTVLDLARCLGGSRHETETRAQLPGSIVLLEQSGRLVGLAVDSVRDVRPLDDVGLGVDGNAFCDEGAFVQGLASAGGELVTMLDVAALLTRHLISSGET